MIPIFSHTCDSFVEALFPILGKGRRHAGQFYTECFRKGQCDLKAPWIEQQALPLMEKIKESVDFSLAELSQEQRQGEAVKFLLKYHDGLESESVIIPMKAGSTLCVSSQIGCKMGCTFCETGRMGLIRNLSTAEIIMQVYYARFHFNSAIRNLVFMGMGEPFDNFDNVMQAVKILTDPKGFGFGPSHITLSTSGRVDGIYRMIEEADPALNLAVSVNASNDEMRKRLMPVNRKWNMQELKEAMLAYCKHPRRKILIEYVLLKGVNDSLECADELAAYLEGLKVKVNLIPYNAQTKDRFAPPDDEALDDFLSRIREKGYQVMLRHSKGRDIRGACGQLGNINLRRKLVAGYK